MEEMRWLSVDVIAKYPKDGRKNIFSWIEKESCPLTALVGFEKIQEDDVDIWVKSGKAGNMVNTKEQ